MKLKGVIFDFDGTLAATLPVVFTAVRNAVGMFSDRELTDHDITSMFGPNEVGIMQRLVPDDWEAAYRAYLEEYEQAHHLCKELYPGMRAALDTLKARGIRLAVVTGRGAESAAISTDYLGLTSYFDAFECGKPEKTVKCDAILRILGDWNIAPDEAAYVGDMVADVVESKKAGVYALAAAWGGFFNVDELQASGPDALFYNVPEMMNWLEERL